MIIRQEKTDKELEDYANKIIELLADLNIAEKWKVINSLHVSLFDIIKQDGTIIELLKK